MLNDLAIFCLILSEAFDLIVMILWVWFLISSRVLVPTIWPSRMKMNSSHSSSTSLRMWDEMKIVEPFLLRSMMILLNSAWTSGSSPLVGSSRIKSLGLLIRAVIRATFW